MLTDIFANRYSSVPLWSSFQEADRRFLVQGFRIISERLFPYYQADGKENPLGKAHWKSIHDRLSMELGLPTLSSKHYSYNQTWQGQTTTKWAEYTWEDMCKNYVYTPFDGKISADKYMKERVSLIEIAFRERDYEVKAENLKLPQDIKASEESMKVLAEWSNASSGSTRSRVAKKSANTLVENLKNANRRLNEYYNDVVHELNTRMQQAGYALTYHGGFIQRSSDSLVEKQIAEPFWALIADPKWANVDTDLKEAIDRRDTKARDPAFYAARALESAIKIISDDKGWSTGNERGAHNYIDNLGSNRAKQFIASWEVDALKLFFTNIRNPFGHGPGPAPMPSLDEHQTDWAIESCMSWIKSLANRAK